MTFTLINKLPPTPPRTLYLLPCFPDLTEGFSKTSSHFSLPLLMLTRFWLPTSLKLLLSRLPNTSTLQISTLKHLLHWSLHSLHTPASLGFPESVLSQFLAPCPSIGSSSSSSSLNVGVLQSSSLGLDFSSFSTQSNVIPWFRCHLLMYANL